MSYQAEISRDNPACFLFLIDQSWSMTEEYSSGEVSQRMCSGVADTINRWLQELSIKCAKSEGIRDYYSVGVLGYGQEVSPSFAGSLEGQELIPISEIADNPAKLVERTKKVSDGAGGLVEQTVRVPVWFSPVASGGTPMCEAADTAKGILERWIAEHPDGFPPIVINITDGESTDGDPTENLQALTSLSTTDGNVMLLNIHLSANKNASSVSFTDSVDDLPGWYSHMLFQTSSPLTPAMRELAKEHGFETSEESRCFVLNGDMVLLVQAIDIGTRPSNVQMEGHHAEVASLPDVDADIDAADEAEDGETDEPQEPDWSGDPENPR